MKKVLLTLLSILMLVSFVLGGCSSKGDDVIKIGLITPKTGQVAQYGIAVENAVNLAIDEVNANGGIDGKQIKLISYDNKADATESINVFNRLVDNDEIVALVGPVISSTSLSIAPIANEKQIPMITPTATNLAVTPDYEYVFRACYTDPYQGGTVAKFATENVGATKAAILYNSGDDYSTGLAEAFKATFETAGGEVTNYEGYTADDKDFKAVLTNVKESNPDVIFIPDYYNNIGLIAGQIAEVGIDATLLGGDGWDDVQKEYAEVVDGDYFANHYAIDDPSEVVQNFIASYKENFDETPNALGALGYDAAKILLGAIESAGSTEGEAILEALKATEIDGVTGHITFDEKGDPQKSISMIKVEDGEIKLETKIGQ